MPGGLPAPTRARCRPGGTLTTVHGPGRRPGLARRSVRDRVDETSLARRSTGRSSRSLCDGTQEGDALCSTPRIGGSAGNFRFTVAPTLVAKQSGSSSVPVTLGELYFDKTVLKKKAPVRIFYQKAFGDPVIELRKCTAKIRTECFNLTMDGGPDRLGAVQGRSPGHTRLTTMIGATAPARRGTISQVTEQTRRRRSTCATSRGCAASATGSTGSTRSRWTSRRSPAARTCRPGTSAASSGSRTASRRTAT